MRNAALKHDDLAHGNWAAQPHPLPVQYDLTDWQALPYQLSLIHI